ncbi:MAG: thioredoxin family protein [Candidatus Micrarchaeota archaeon]|nr:thioredoxin family protein [Candidatus Micrarchaeota archaeon]MDE1848245.1 thioredoxin family protein [Candidatus Micrarchaeota archaeon]MDE1864901.1 thioredoxin family protein [Candidatus Micrarchaeota archaeon]
MDLLDEKSIHTAIGSTRQKMVLFFADWCPFCRKFRPIFKRYESSSGLWFAEAKINEDSNPMWDEFKIDYIPTVIAFKSGKIIARKDAVPKVGLSEEDLKGIIAKVK